ncbi:MAG: patatin-like phospholipase family protein, partial [Gammaproteobacteria bacterium]
MATISHHEDHGGNRQSHELDSQATVSLKQPKSKTHRARTRPPFECIALVLQGGGSLGAYQGGVYEALSEAGLHPDWIAGISIGAINSAIIAGNAREHRVQKLREFWEGVTENPLWGLSDATFSIPPKGDAARAVKNQWSAGLVMLGGSPGFFTPRMPSPWMYPWGTMAATSYYDTGALKRTLERLVDFDRINGDETRLSMGAVNVQSGNFVYFDTTTHDIGPEHVMASGALPPGFPPIEIEGEHYWDGGLVSNTPLQWVVDAMPHMDTLAFQVDLWNARGVFPRNMAEVETRRKEIQYSSRTRAGTNAVKFINKLRCTIADLLEKLPPELRETKEARILSTVAEHKVYNIIHLIYRARLY